MREFRLVFGATTAATAAVLAIFMAGLGAGSAILGKRADSVANPLFLYGVLEAAIALSVAITPWLVALASTIYINLGGQESLGLIGATIVRLALATVVMAIPSFLMGGTLPAAVRAVTPASDVHRRALSVLYGFNTLGAVVGTAAATLFALENVGTRATLWLGCAIGLLVGSIAVGQSRTLRPLASRDDASFHNTPTDKLVSGQFAMTDDARPWLIYVTAALLGFSFFALELVWYRMLAPILGGTAFTFGLILCVALFGIGVGGIAYNLVFNRIRPSWSALAVTCGCEAMLTMVPFAMGDRLAVIAAGQADSAAYFSQLVYGWSYIICIVVLPVALISGLQFPLLTGLLGHGRRAVSAHLGRAYAWNTLGAIAGSLVAGFGAIPLLSAIGMWQTVAGLLAVLSICILVGAPRIDRRSVAVVAVLALATFGSMFFATGPTAAWRHGGIGVGRATIAISDPNAIQQWLNEKRHSLVWEADGVECSVGIDGGDGLAFIVNGKCDGNSLGDAATQIGVAALGAVLHKDPKSALVIGLGTGESAGWFAEMRGVEHVDVVELEPAIDEVASRCSELNWNVLHHPRVRRIHADGREYVFTTHNTYDVVFSEPSNPYRAGVAALYTTEFYHAVRQRLNPGGLFVQWLQAYEVDEDTVLTVLATARAAFNHVEVWQTLSSDLQLVCSDTPIEYSAKELRDRIGSGKVKDALAKTWYVDNLEDFLAHFVASARYVDAVARVSLIMRNTDDRTILEYSFAKTAGHRSKFSIESLRERLNAFGYQQPSLGDGIDWNRVEIRRQELNLLFYGELSLALLPRTEDQALVEALNRYQHNDFAGAIKLWPAEHRHPSDAVLRLLLARTYAELGRSDCLDLISAAEPRYPIDSAAVLAIYYSRSGNTAQASRSLEAFFSLLAESPWLIPVISDSAFSCAVDVAQADPVAAKRLYPLLARPFASHRFDYLRQRTRVLVATQLGPNEVVDALADLEPHVIWTSNILKSRMEAYAVVNHPLAKRAERDWQWFEQHQTSK